MAMGIGNSRRRPVRWLGDGSTEGVVSSFRRGSVWLLALALAVFSYSCGEERGPIELDPEVYRDAVSSFYAGVAAMEVGADAHAEEELLHVTRLAPEEPAAWADLGLLALRRNEFDAAEERLERAVRLAPDAASVQMLLGRLESERGRLESAVARFRRAIELDSTDIRAIYALTQELDRSGDRDAPDEIRLWLERILRRAPDNRAAMMELSRLYIRRENVSGAAAVIEELGRDHAGWSAEAREQFDSLRAAVGEAEFREAATRAAFLHNLLLNDPEYRDDLAALRPPDEQVAPPIERFLRLPVPRPSPAAADDSLSLATRPLPEAGGSWDWVGAYGPTDENGVAALLASSGQVRLPDGTTLPFPGGGSLEPPAPHAVLALDYDSDFRADLALAGAGGFRLFRRSEGGGFLDVTGATGLPASRVRSGYRAVWAADLDLEGDLDLLLSRVGGGLEILRNDGDGTFTAVEWLRGLEGVRAFAWADLDGDGDPDPAFIDGEGTLRAFENRRGARFVEWSPPAGVGPGLALIVGDPEADGRIGLVLLSEDGAIVLLTRTPGDRGWQTSRLATWDDLPSAAVGSPTTLFLQDLDNNGGLDLIASHGYRTAVWLQSERREYDRPAADLELQTFAVAPLSGGDRLDLLGLTREGDPTLAVSRTRRGYGWARLRPRAAATAGDQRINSFGIGGEVELRADLIFQKQPITGPLLHFGLGDRSVAELARILWPNGVVQAEFDLARGESIVATQRLKGSCPWVFAHDGQGMRFITDFLWRSPLGMRINARQTAVPMTEDRIKIPGDALAARDGGYEIRITAELWETHFFDHVSLLVVDHPEGSEIFVDERFAVPPPDPSVRTTGPVRPVVAARDDRGVDVTGLVRAVDGRYVDSFGRGWYQGVTRDHHIELELGDEVPDSGPVWLVGSGWVRPTDSSINVALSQGGRPSPAGLRLEVPDGRGGWTVARDGLGFPAGKSKTVLIDLRDLPSGVPSRIRLATNLEVYWDRIGWAAGRQGRATTERRVAPRVAELRYRGFSAVQTDGPSSPERPIYEALAGTAPYWLDLPGRYTRFGDVRELLEAVDDRYVIMNAGDELVLRFPAPAPPPPGQVRDFVLVGDGWVKDGDFNTRFSESVLPLPAHDRPGYEALTGPSAGRLVDDPVYRRHARDWVEYHTRYVDSKRFRGAMRSGLEER